jgi:DNA-binding XRE family transcriptional regulator
MYMQIEEMLEVIGKRFLEARQAREEEIDAVAKAAGLSIHVMNEIEEGVYYDLEVFTMFKICDYLQISVSDMLSGRETCL